MATFDAHANLAYTNVANAPGTSGTTLMVTAGQGGIFPVVPFNCTVWPRGGIPTDANAEIIRVTAINTDTLTITRAQEGTSAQNIGIGYQIANTATAKIFTDLETAINSGSLNATISVTYTGTPITPLAIHVFPQAIYATTTGTGSPVTFTQSTEASFRAGFDYEEGVNMPSGMGLSAITFNDLKSGANIYVANCSNLTSVVFSALLDAEQLHIGANLPLMSTLSLPVFVQTVLSETAIGGSGNFSISGCASLVTLSLPALTTVGAGIVQTNAGFFISTNNALTTLSTPVLAVVNGWLNLAADIDRRPVQPPSVDCPILSGSYHSFWHFWPCHARFAHILLLPGSGDSREYFYPGNDWNPNLPFFSFTFLGWL